LSFDPKPLDAAAEWIDWQRALWNARLDVLESLLREEDRAAAKTPVKPKRNQAVLGDPRAAREAIRGAGFAPRTRGGLSHE
jgi:hypothetical protein